MCARERERDTLLTTRTISGCKLNKGIILFVISFNKENTRLKRKVQSDKAPPRSDQRGAMGLINLLNYGGSV